MKITPQKNRQCVQIAFILEPILDKNGCSTRFHDLPGKPISDFLISAINIGQIIEGYADTVINKKSRQLFSHFHNAIQISNEYKSKKYMNVGLLEAMFVSIKTRLDSNSLEEALNNYKNTQKNTNNQDIVDYIKAFKLAWSTARNGYKRDIIETMEKEVSKYSNFYDWYELKLMMSKDPSTSTFQWIRESREGYPLIKRFVEEIDESNGLIKSIENSYNKIHAENPLLKVGILADLSAAALFLYLSYQDPETYMVK